MNIVPPVSAFSVFLSIAVAGGCLLLVSAVFGGILEHLDGLDDYGGSGFFSTRAITVFVTAFGAAGAVASYFGFGPVAASTGGAVTGLVFGGAIGLLGRFLYRQQASSEVRTSDLVGQIGRVIVAIPSGGVGQIRCRVGEELVDKIARTRDGAAVSDNASVQIDDVLGETVIVTAKD